MVQNKVMDPEEQGTFMKKFTTYLVRVPELGFSVRRRYRYADVCRVSSV